MWTLYKTQFSTDLYEIRLQSNKVAYLVKKSYIHQTGNGINPQYSSLNKKSFDVRNLDNGERWDVELNDSEWICAAYILQSTVKYHLCESCSQYKVHQTETRKSSRSLWHFNSHQSRVFLNKWQNRHLGRIQVVQRWGHHHVHLVGSFLSTGQRNVFDDHNRTFPAFSPTERPPTSSHFNQYLKVIRKGISQNLWKVVSSC